VLKLFRSIELADRSAEEIAGHLVPTAAYIEDELRASPECLWLCGFGAEAGAMAQWLESELKLRASPLATPAGPPGEYTAGLRGYLESLKES
jgi:hypothetical protein